MELLQCEKDAATAAVEAEVLEVAVQSQIDGHDSDLPSLERSLRTESYVLAQAKVMENVMMLCLFDTFCKTL